VRLLLDTHLLLWAAAEPEKLSPAARELIAAPENDLVFSAASLWEVAIKTSLGRPDFRVDAGALRRGLGEAGYDELPIFGRHVVAVGGLPALHKDPFDRLLVAQALTEGITLVTADEMVAAYPGPIRRV
jgi:PIN domain nuclease of toxin-antitoxin system